MALTINKTLIRYRHLTGDLRVGFVTLQYSGTYATGGDAVTPGDFGLGTIEICLPTTVSDGTSAFTTFYNASTGKLMLFGEDGTGASAGLPFVQAANAASLTSFTATLMVLGK